MKSGDCDPKDIMRVTLSAEESLLRIRDSLGDDGNFHIRCIRFLNTNTVTVTVSGKNVTEQFESDDSFAIPLNYMLSADSVHPSYSYESGVNKVKLEVKGRHRLSLMQKSLLAIAAGGVLGGLALLLPGTVGSEIGTKIVSPLFSTFIGVAAAVAALMVFLTVTQSIYLIGDKNAFQKIGGRFFKNTIGKMLLVSVICALACVPLFHSGVGGGGQMDIYQIYDMILDIVPTNVVSPFLNGNVLQILFLRSVWVCCCFCSAAALRSSSISSIRAAISSTTSWNICCS